jgi:hypothetical protein
MNSLVGADPKLTLPHGPTKLLVDDYLWHSPEVGIVASYTPKARDVLDHFGVFRGVDQIESFGQATVVSCGGFLECQKQGISFAELYERYNSAFMGVSSVKFHNFVPEGQMFINVGIMEFYKFKQAVFSGKIFAVPHNFNVKTYFKSYTDEKLRKFELPPEFTIVSEFNGMVGKGIKKQKFAS